MRVSPDVVMPAVESSPRRRHVDAAHWETGAYLLFALLVVAAVFLNSRGQVAPDTEPQLYYAPGRTLVQALFAWQDSPSVGNASFNAGIAPIALLILVLRSLGASLWVTIRIWRVIPLLAAGWGAVRFFDRMAGTRSNGAGRVTAAVLYVANPYVIVSGATLPVLLPYALFPWMMLSFAQSVDHPRSWRWPAGFALSFFLMGGMNAGIVPIYLLLGLPSYLLYAHLDEKRSLGSMLRPTAKCLALLGLVSVYWLVPALLARGSGATIALTTEKPQDVSSTSSYAESLRLLGIWPLYGRNGATPFLPNAVAYVTNPLVVLATFALPAVAAVSAFLSRSRARLLAAILLAVGTPVMVGLFPPRSPSPFGHLLDKLFQHVPGGIGFRTTNKVGALVALALTMLVALGAAEMARRIRGWKPMARFAFAGAAFLLVLVSVFPAWSGGLYPSRWKAIPRYWVQAARDLNIRSPSTRVLFLPGEGFASYRWGKQGPTDINLSLLSRPSIVRQTVPDGSPYAANFLAALDQPLELGSYTKGELPMMARYLGVKDVLVRNDLVWEQWFGVRPSVLSREIKEPGLRLVQAYGDPGEFTTSPGPPGKPFTDRSYDNKLPPLQRYEVVAARPIVRGEAVPGSVVIDGDNFGVVPLSFLGLLPGGPAFRFLGSMTESDLSQAIADGSPIILTDSNRRRAWNFRRTGIDYSATLGPGALYQPEGDLGFKLFGDRSDTQTVSILDGAKAIAASGYGSAFSAAPWDKPSNAFDGDLRTAWLAGGFGAAVGQHVTIQFERPTTISGVTLQPVLGNGRQIASVSIRVGPRTIKANLPPRQALVGAHMPPTTASSLTVTVTSARGSGVNPVGFWEVRVPGIAVANVTRLPVTFARLASKLDPAAYARLSTLPLDLVMVRALGAPGKAADDEEALFDREVVLPQPREFTFTGVASANVFLSDSQIDRLIGVAGSIVAESSSRLEGALGDRASEALDGNPNTSWVPGTSKPGEYLDVKFPARTLDHIVVRQDVPRGVKSLAFISEANISMDGGKPFRASLGPDPTTISFPAQRVHEVRLTIARVAGLGGIVRVSELQIGTVHVQPNDQRSPIRGCLEAFDVNGQAVKVQPPGTLGQLDAGRPFTLAPCGDEPVTLSAGANRIQALRGWQIDLLDLSSVERPTRPSAPAAPPSLEVESHSPTSMTIKAQAAAAPYYLVLGQGYDARWRATMDGKSLGRPILVDGYSVGWRIASLRPHAFQVTFGPQRPLTVSLALSLGGLVLVCGLFFVRRAR